MRVNCRDKAQGPPWSSRPCKRLSVSPQLNQVHNWTSPKKQKVSKSKYHRTCRHVLSPSSCSCCKLLDSFSSKVGKNGGCPSCQTMPNEIKRWVPKTAGNCSTNRPSKWNLKKVRLFTLLRRIANYKSVNSESDWRIKIGTWKGIPRRAHAIMSSKHESHTWPNLPGEKKH